MASDNFFAPFAPALMDYRTGGGGWISYLQQQLA